MSLQFSTAIRNAVLDQMRTTIGSLAKIEIWSGAVPANCGTASSGTKLAEFDLSGAWWNAASAGAKVLAGLPISTTGLANGTAGYFRLSEHDTANTCHMQGTITATGGGGDMTLDNTSINSGQTINITGFTLTAPGA